MSIMTHEVAGQELEGVEASVQLLDNQWVNDFSEAMAYAHGYQVDIALEENLETSNTQLSLRDQKITVHISRELIERAESRDQLDFLGFNILHELGHVKRFKHTAPTVAPDPKDAYFGNITDDIAINFEAAKQTRFFARLTKKAYDEYLFPIDHRDKITNEPKHMQFMESLLLLSMTTDSHRGTVEKDRLTSSLRVIGCEDLDEAVIERLGQVVNFESGKSRFNLLEQLRAHGSDLSYTKQISGHIKKLYDELYEEDTSEQGSSSDGDSSDGAGEDGREFDYSNSGGCRHGEPEQSSASKSTDKDGDDSSKSDKVDNNANKGETAPDPTLADVGKQIGEQMAEAIEEARAEDGSNQKPNQLTAEQLARMRQELNLDESDFQGFLATINKYPGEIAMVTELILQLKRERQDNFLAPSHEISARGHRIHTGKLLGYVASGDVNPRPDIWKTPAFKEKVEYDFDGADFYFLCDTSDSMSGSKAEVAAESAVVLSQGIQDASFESFDNTPPIRIQVQAFGSGDETVCRLTDTPTNKDLGRMYQGLRHPNSNSTQVSGALAKISPDKSRLSVVLVLSDGQFHDESTALTEGKRLENEGAVLVQCVFGGAEVSKLSTSAKRMDIATASDLPTYIFGIMPELLQILRSTHHA